MSVYYNECDPFAAAWLRELMRENLIASGWVDERSIEDVKPIELQGFTQCHFFAGIGVWSLALRVAGWPDERPIWTGSCPCQPFSAAGKGAGFADERHLWPAWYHLIEHGKRRDVVVVGEQVASKDGRAWYDLVSGDMQVLDHTCGAVDTSAASVGAPFIGQRLYWLAASHSREERSREVRRSGDSAACSDRQAVEFGYDGGLRGVAATQREESERHGQQMGGTQRADQSREEQRQRLRDERVSGGAIGRLAASDEQQHDRSGQSRQTGRVEPSDDCTSSCTPLTDTQHGAGIPLHPTEYWRDADWLLCRDPNGACFRPVEPSTLTMADGRTVRWRLADGCGEGEKITTHFPLAQTGEYLNRLNEVRGAGNALNISQAACFIEAVMEVLDL